MNYLFFLPKKVLEVESVKRKELLLSCHTVYIKHSIVESQLQGWAEVFRENFNHQHQELVIKDILLRNNFSINFKKTNYSM